MAWQIEYYEQADGLQPAELFEDSLETQSPKLAGKLLRLIDEIAEQGPNLGGGYLESCHGYPGLWEIRARHHKLLGREFLGFDGNQVILLHGYVKQEGQPAVAREFQRSDDYWQEYLTSKRISPEEDEKR